MVSSPAHLSAQRTGLLEYVGRQVHDSALSEDIVQEAYLRLLIFEAKPDNSVKNAPALLRRISLNLVRDHSAAPAGLRSSNCPTRSPAPSR